MSWIQVQSETIGLTHFRLEYFDNKLLIFILQGPKLRVSSWVEANIEVHPLSGKADHSVEVLFGDRDCIWTRVIARRILEETKQNVLLGILLSKESHCEAAALELSTKAIELLRNQRPFT